MPPKKRVEICNTCGHQRVLTFESDRRMEEWAPACGACSDDNCALYSVDAPESITRVAGGGPLVGGMPFSRKRGAPDVQMPVLQHSILTELFPVSREGGAAQQQQQQQRPAEPRPSAQSRQRQAAAAAQPSDADPDLVQQLRREVQRLTDHAASLSAQLDKVKPELRSLREQKRQFEVKKSEARHLMSENMRLINENKKLATEVQRLQGTAGAAAPEAPRRRQERAERAQQQRQQEQEQEQEEAPAPEPTPVPAQKEAPKLPPKQRAKAGVSQREAVPATPPTRKRAAPSESPAAPPSKASKTRGSRAAPAAESTVLDWGPFGLNEELVFRKHPSRTSRGGKRERPPLDRTISYLQLIRYYTRPELREVASSLGFGPRTLNLKLRLLAYDLWSFMIKGTIARGASEDDDEDEEEEEEEGEGEDPPVAGSPVPSTRADTDKGVPETTPNMQDDGPSPLELNQSSA